MKNPVNRLFKLIKWGKEGKNLGVAFGMPKLEKLIAGVQRRIYTVLAGSTGSGKTTFALYAYIYKPLIEMLGDPKFKIVYYSLEMTAEVLLAKLASIYIWDNYGVEIPFDTILSRSEIISEEHYNILLEVREWLEKVQEHLIIYDKGINSDGIAAHLREYAECNGEFEETETGEIYTPHIEGQFVIVIVDHIGLLRRKPGQSKKDSIDAASNHLIYFRNKCSYSPVILMQVNRQSSSMDRRNGEMQEIQLDDLKDSGTPSEDADIVLALFNPFREKMSSYRGFKMKIIKDILRSIIVLKNRYGDADKYVPLSFFGSVGLFRELPYHDITAPTEQEYAIYTNIAGEESNNIGSSEEKPTESFRFTF